MQSPGIRSARVRGAAARQTAWRLVTLSAASLLLTVSACGRSAERGTPDSAFTAVQQRGATVMGVDQYTSKHVFEDLPDGGRVVLDRDDASDTAAVRTIRAHMRDIEAAFKQGNFAAPGLVHAREVPGTRVMAAKKDAISYRAVDRPRGAELQIRTTDPAAVAAVHQFLAFQRSDHRAPGHEKTH
jgi:hypothetical protein